MKSVKYTATGTGYYNQLASYVANLNNATASLYPSLNTVVVTPEAGHERIIKDIENYIEQNLDIISTEVSVNPEDFDSVLADSACDVMTLKKSLTIALDKYTSYGKSCEELRKQLDKAIFDRDTYYKWYNEDNARIKKQVRAIVDLFNLLLSEDEEQK